MISTCVNDTGEKFAAGVNAIIANLWKDVTTSLFDTISEFSTSDNDTGGHIVAGVVDTGDAPLELRISSGISEKFQNVTLGIRPGRK